MKKKFLFERKPQENLENFLFSCYMHGFKTKSVSFLHKKNIRTVMMKVRMYEGYSESNLHLF
jgi:hypothetical protein